MPTAYQKMVREDGERCRDCGHDLDDWGVPGPVCPQCRENRRQSDRARYVRRLVEGRCVCGAHALPGRVQCQDCREKAQERYMAKLDPERRAKLEAKRERRARLDMVRAENERWLRDVDRPRA